MLEIVYLSNYKFILYKDEEKRIFLMLTIEQGFGVYDFTFEASFTDFDNTELTLTEINKYRSDYIKDQNGFKKQNVEVTLDSKLTKHASEKWFKSNA